MSSVCSSCYFRNYRKCGFGNKEKFPLEMATSECSSSDDYLFGSPGEGKRKCEAVQLSDDEEALMIRMYNLVGDRWSLIAGRIPGRTAEEIKKYWMTRYGTNNYS